MIALDPIQRELLLEGLDDYVGLWEVARDLRRFLGELPPEKIRELAMMKLRPLLQEGLILPGFPAEGGEFAAWDCDVDEAIDRINAEWRQLGRDPNVWEICWFKNTEKGDALARTIGG